jgi:hypothetical protein
MHGDGVGGGVQPWVPCVSKQVSVSRSQLNGHPPSMAAQAQLICTSIGQQPTGPLLYRMSHSRCRGGPLATSYMYSTVKVHVAIETVL